MFWSWPASLFVEGVKSGSGNCEPSSRPAGNLCPQMVRSPDIPSNLIRPDNRERRTPPAAAQFCARASNVPASCSRNGANFSGKFELHRDHVIRREGETLKPKSGELVQDRALVRDGIGQNAIEGGDAVGYDEEEGFAEIENLADLSAAKFRDGKIESAKEGVRHQSERRMSNAERPTSNVGSRQSWRLHLGSRYRHGRRKH